MIFRLGGTGFLYVFCLAGTGPVSLATICIASDGSGDGDLLYVLLILCSVNADEFARRPRFVWLFGLGSSDPLSVPRIYLISELGCILLRPKVFIIQCLAASAVY